VGTPDGTTNEEALRIAQPTADVVSFQDHAGFLALEQGTSSRRTLTPAWSGERLQVARLRETHLIMQSMSE